MLFLISCSEGGTTPTPELIPTPPSASETLYYNGRIYTVDATMPWAEAMIVSDGVISFIGSSAGAKVAATEGTVLIDLNGTFVLPGLHDIHLHPLEASSSNFHFTISDEVNDAEEYYKDVLEAHEASPGDGWLLGWGHYIHTVIESKRMPREILDDISSTRPIAIMEQTSHSLWVNSKALQLAGITIESEDPVGGVIMRDDRTDEPNGILIDNAGNVLLDMALTPTAERSERDYNSLIEYGLPEIAKHGITSISDARTYWKRDHHKTWQRLADNNELTARVNLGLWVYPNDSDEDQITIIKSLFEDHGELLHINQVKVYMDGIIPNTTAALHDDYEIDLFDYPSNNGLNYLTQERLEKYITQLEPVGFDFHIHAIGDRGIREALNTIENSGTASGRHRITHVELVDPSDYKRFGQLNVTADCQVAGDFTNPDQWHENDEFIGEERSDVLVPIKDLLANEARLCLSSDWDVSPLDPFVGIQNAVTRAPQNISLEDAIRGYTIHPAYVMRQEEKVGSLEVGKEADFIILDKNIFEVAPTQISTIKVVSTYLQGEKVYPR